MAEVTNIERAVAPVKTVTLKLTRTEAYELMDYITEYHNRYPYMGKAEGNPLHKALRTGVDGKTTSQVAAEKQLKDIFASAPQVSVTPARF